MLLVVMVREMTPRRKHPELAHNSQVCLQSQGRKEQDDSKPRCFGHQAGTVLRKEGESAAFQRILMKMTVLSRKVVTKE